MMKKKFGDGRLFIHSFVMKKREIVIKKVTKIIFQLAVNVISRWFFFSTSWAFLPLTIDHCSCLIQQIEFFLVFFYKWKTILDNWSYEQVVWAFRKHNFIQIYILCCVLNSFMFFIKIWLDFMILYFNRKICWDNMKLGKFFK